MSKCGTEGMSPRCAGRGCLGDGSGRRWPWLHCWARAGAGGSGQRSAGCVPPEKGLAVRGPGGPAQGRERVGGGVAGAAPATAGAVLINCAPLEQPPHKSSPERNQERALPHPFNKSVL